MSNKVEEIDIKNQTFYVFNDNINIKNFDPNNIKLDEKSFKDILIYYISYLTIKSSKYIKINNVNLSYLIFSKVSWYFEEIDKSKYLTLVPTNKSKEKKYKELWSKVKVIVIWITKKSDDYDKKYVKVKSNSDDELPLNKTIEFPSMIIVVRAVFHENKKYFPQVFLD